MPYSYSNMTNELAWDIYENEKLELLMSKFRLQFMNYNLIHFSIDII